MKKLFLLLLSLLFISISYAQWSVGARAGANFATITGKYSDYDDAKSGWITALAIGPAANYEFTDMISLNGELLFITIGDKSKYTETGEKSSMADEYNYTITERYHYLQLPILARFSFGSNFLFYGNIGPYCGYKIGGHYKEKTPYYETKGRTRFKEDKMKENDWLFDPDSERRFDFGLYIGGGAGKKLGPGVLEADVRVGIGLLDHNKFDDKDAKKEAKDYGYKSFKTMNISLTLAYMIGILKNQPARFLAD